MSFPGAGLAQAMGGLSTGWEMLSIPRGECLGPRQQPLP